MALLSCAKLAVAILACATLADGRRRITGAQAGRQPALYAMNVTRRDEATETDEMGGKGRPTKEEWEKTKAGEAEQKAAAAAREAKMAAVNKVVKMLESLQAKVLSEGEAEAKTYNKFACFCKDTTKEKSASIKKGQDDKATLTSTIEKLQAKRKKLDETIKKLEEEISKLEEEMKAAEATRSKELKLYETNAADLQAALDALHGAIKSVKASKAPSMVQLKALSRATALADVLGLGGAAAKSVDAAFLQQPSNEVPMENYKFHSSGIIDTLEMLLDSFRKEKQEVDAEEVKAVKLHTELIQSKTRLAQQKEQEVKDHQKSKAETTEEIEMNSKELTTVAANLLEDTAYLDELAEMCSHKAKTWDQRTKARQNELTTLTEVIGIISSKVADNTQASTLRFAQTGVNLRMANALASSDAVMEAMEAEAEAVDAQPAMLLQEASNRSKPAANAGRRAAADLLLRKGKLLKSTLLLSLAGQIGAGNDPFAKVKVLIQELIERLLDEASKEADHKGWCDKATTDATQKRDYAAKEIKSLNGEMATLEALRDKLTDELADLAKDIKELTDDQKKAKFERLEEKKENKETVDTAKAGLDAVNMAIGIITKFYATVKKEKVDLSLAQRGPADDAPDAGFDNGEAYLGAQSSAEGIIGLMDVMKSDFERTISETEKAEDEAQKEYMKFMTETGMSLMEKTEASKARTDQKAAAEKKLDKAEDNLAAETEILTQKIKELRELKPVCVDTGMSYADRVARREDEISSLQKALCILEAFEQYGPEGLADAC